MKKVFTLSKTLLFTLFSISSKLTFFLVFLKSGSRLAVKLVGGHMNTLNSVRRFLFISVALAAYSSCNKVNFTEVPQPIQTSLSTPPMVGEPPVGPVTPPPGDDEEPVVVVPPPEPPTPAPEKVAKLTDGVCASDSSTQLLSCMNCQVPLNPPAPPQLSVKGEALLDIMSLSCEAAVRPYHSSYVGPTREQLLVRLNRASPTLYPDSTLSTSSRNVINALKDPNNAATRNSTFGGIWYSSNGLIFERYFGLSISEAVYTFCGEVGSPTFTPTNTTTLKSKEYTDCQNEASPWTTCTESAQYISANTYRNQLRNAMRQSISNPYVAPAPTPEKTCHWEKFEGDDMDVAQAKLQSWTAAGYTTGMSIESGDGSGYCGATLPDHLNNRTLTISAYKCE